MKELLQKINNETMKHTLIFHNDIDKPTSNEKDPKRRILYPPSMYSISVIIVAIIIAAANVKQNHHFFVFVVFTNYLLFKNFQITGIKLTYYYFKTSEGRIVEDIRTVVQRQNEYIYIPDLRVYANS